MHRTLGHVTLLVRDYDEAITFFTGSLGFRPRRGHAPWRRQALGPGRAVGRPGSSLLLARASTPEQTSSVGKQAGDRVFLFLYTDDFARDHARMMASGVKFLEHPREEGLTAPWRSSRTTATSGISCSAEPPRDSTSCPPTAPRQLRPADYVPPRTPRRLRGAFGGPSAGAFWPAAVRTSGANPAENVPPTTRAFAGPR